MTSGTGFSTLPASIAIRDPNVAELFCDPTQRSSKELTAALQAALPEAERLLDKIAEEARHEAAANARDPRHLFTLINHTRALSRR